MENSYINFKITPFYFHIFHIKGSRPAKKNAAVGASRADAADRLGREKPLSPEFVKNFHKTLDKGGSVCYDSFIGGSKHSGRQRKQRAATIAELHSAFSEHNLPCVKRERVMFFVL